MAFRFVIQLSIIVCIAMASFNSPLLATSVLVAASIDTDDTNITLSALLALKHSISLDPTSFLASWNTSDYCTWRGILCSPGTHHVVSIALDSNQLAGTLTPLLGDLSYLSTLSIYNNSFYGSIPPQLGKLAALVELDFRLNNLTGSIPYSLAQCTRLEVLALDNNSLSSQFPPFLTSLSHLQYVGFSSNLNITGEIPPDIGRLANLTYFQTFSGSLTGTLPASITNCTKLLWLNLGINRLSGPIPSDWSKLTGSLEQLVLAQNFFVGSIPQTLGNCTKLKILALQINNLGGEIPKSFGRLALLQELRLFENNLTGTIPISIMNCTQLKILQLGQNNIQGGIPQEIGQLTQLQFLHLSKIAQLAGGIPHTLGECKQMQYLYIENTSVGGSLPMSLYNLTNMQYLKLSDSGLSGSLDEAIQNFSQLISLRLGSNSFEGRIPANLGRLKRLQSLELQGNSFKGPIPPELSGCTSIFEMDLSHNSLLGTIPPTLGQLQTLTNLYLQYNGLSGKIPDMFGSMIRLQSLNLAGNMLTGPIPDSLATLSTLGVLLDMSFNALSGAIPVSVGSMQTLVTLKLSGNQFTGEIPSSLGKCLGMQILDLSINQLQSEIPSELAQMKSLQYLNLSKNNLSGSLPPSLGDLPDLVSLNVSYNSLQGMIPTNGTYGNMSSSSFLGNPGLCGHPLATSCRSVRSSHHSKNIVIIVPVCVVGVAIILIATVCACLRWWHCMTWEGGEAAPSSRETESIDDSDNAVLFGIQLPQYKAWTAEELRAATNGFDAANVIGAGGLSECYRGVVMEGEGKKKLVAVKRLRVGPGSSGEEARRSFVNELKTICKVRHRNLVRVEGYCVEGGEVALVMEFMGKGSLHEHLHPNNDDDDDARRLSWQERVNVAADVAEGLVYLHHEYVQPIIHCDVKPSNILLASDSEGTAKLGDFGIARLVESGHATRDLSNSRFRGSVGYAAPECANGSRISTKCDVYSYGVLLIELVTGLSPINPQFQQYGGMSLHEMIKSLHKSGRIKEAFSKFMQREIDLEPIMLQEAEYLLNMGVICTSESPNNRPTMRIARECINRVKWNRLHKI